MVRQAFRGRETEMVRSSLIRKGFDVDRLLATGYEQQVPPGALVSQEQVLGLDGRLVRERGICLLACEHGSVLVGLVGDAQTVEQPEKLGWRHAASPPSTAGTVARFASPTARSSASPTNAATKPATPPQPALSQNTPPAAPATLEPM